MESHLLVQISDVHLTSSGTLALGARPRDNLLACLRALETSRIRPDVVLLTGDLADAGEGPCYADLRQVLDGFNARYGATLVCLPGNHDDRAAFRQHLLGTAAELSPVNQTYWHAGLRIIALDSTVRGEAYGLLDDATLSFLASELATRAPDGTVVALHHPPIPSPIEPMSQLRLRNADELRQVVAGSDVRVILCGHNHHPAGGILGTVPVWISPSTAYIADVTSTEVFRGVPGSAVSRIDLSDAGHTVTVISVAAALPQIGHRTAVPG